MEAVRSFAAYVPWLDTDPSFIISDPLMIGRLQSLSPRPEFIVDAGCGSGTLLYNLHKWFPTAVITGVDASPSTSDRVGPLVPSARIVVGDVLKIPIASDEADLVTATQVIEHVEEGAFLRELHRILRPQGTLFISSVVKRRGAWFFYRNAEGKTVLEPTHLREYESLDAFTRVMQSYGFDVKHASEKPVRFSVYDFVARRLGGNAKASCGWRLAVRKMSRVRVPGYYYCECIAKRA